MMFGMFLLILAAFLMMHFGGAGEYLTGSLINPKDLAILLLQSILLYTAGESLAFLWRIVVNQYLARKTPFYKAPRHANARILIAGDSLAAGTGAHDPRDTIAGRFAHDYPTAEVVNASNPGALISGIAAQFENYKDQSFDLIVLSAGGNNVWHMTSMKKLAESTHDVLARAKAMSHNQVIFIPSTYFTLSPSFPLVLRILFRNREKKINATIQYITKEDNVECVELFTQEKNNPFIENPKIFFARDGIHPSSEGYRIWYNHIISRLVRRGYLITTKLQKKIRY